MHPSIIIFLIGSGVALGIIGYTYHLGSKSCISQYEYESTKNALENEKKEIDNYKKQIEFNDELAGEADLYIKTLELSYAELQKKIDSIKFSSSICVDADLLYDLAKLRRSLSKQENTKFTQ